MLGDSLRANPDSFVKTFKDAQLKLMTGQYAYPHVKIRYYFDIVCNLTKLQKMFFYSVQFVHVASNRGCLPRER